jgi:hypothetical protein
LLWKGNPMKKVTKKRSKRGGKSSKRKAPDRSHIRKSKTDDFMEKFKSGRATEAMVEYFTNLRIMNPAAKLISGLNEPRREGGFVRLAHAREEFTAPILTKGKSVTPPKAARPRKKRRKK